MISTILALAVRAAITCSFTQARAITIFVKRETRFEVGAPAARLGARFFTAKVVTRTVGVLGNGTALEVIAPLAGGRITGGLGEVLASASELLSVDADIFIGTVLAVIVGVDSARSGIIRVR